MTLTAQDIIPMQMRLLRCGYVNLFPNWNKNDGSSRFSRLYLVEEGSGYLKTATETIHLEPGYAYLIPANFQHAYGCTKLKKLYFMFTLTSKESTDILSRINSVCRIRYAPEDLDTLLEHYESAELLSVLTVRQTILKLVCALLQESNVPPVSLNRNSPLVEKAVAYIQANLRITLTIEQISSRLFVSESKLRTVFQKETGVPVGQYIDSLVLQKAQQLLRQSNLSIGEISSQLGFCDQFYFSRRFKEKLGLTPSAYRKNSLSPSK